MLQKKMFYSMFSCAGIFAFASCVHAEGTSTIKLERGAQQVYSQTPTIKRVAVANPDVADVQIMNKHRLLVLARQAGSTEIRVWDDKSPDPYRLIKVTVDAPTELLNQKLSQLGANDSKIEATGEMLALTGKSDSLEKHDLARNALQNASKEGTQDASTSGFDNQVQIDIKVVEVSRKRLMQAGVFLGKNTSSSTIAVSPPGVLSGVVTGDTGGLVLKSASGFLPLANAFNLVFGSSSNGLLGTLSLLESNGFAYTLAEPTLTAISGQTATFLAGGEFPVPVSSGSGDGNSSITIQYKEYGVRVMLTPTVLDSQRIFLKVSPEVSELDFTNAVRSGGVQVPGLRVRRTDTSLSLGDGESFVLSGLVSRNTNKNVDQIPGLGDVPILGAFFRSTAFDTEDKELLMVVTPHLVRPIARNAPLPALPGQKYRDYKPSFSELLFGRTDQDGVSPTGMSR
jgi:pilus assembly protein CpaC